ncbi:MAG: nitrophenyl compound nitroreductase subunit ArsF family protein [Alphaproteobacteria bacterium]|nr:nitrophenyl compound nitroreductase subunit ArsF family protein [Alphaproteobacteria bacterium]
MNTKKITTLVLLLFVVASVGTIVAKERGAQPAPEAAIATAATEVVAAQPASHIEEQPVSAESVQAQNTSSAAVAPAAQEKAAPAKVVAYYFHGNMRCTTCKKIEALTTEAIETGFADDIKSGRVELKVVNVEESGNEHYIQDYQLASRSVVVARYEGEAQKDWKRLDEVWQLVSDKDAFIRFVQEQTTNLLKGQSS